MGRIDDVRDNRIDNIVECAYNAYNMDNGYVEVWFTDGNQADRVCGNGFVRGDAGIL